MPSHGLKIETIDAHVGGQPLRLVLSGFPEPRGATMIDKCRYAAQNYDHLRGAILLEPRGHPDMYACILTPPQRHDSHFGALFMHRSGISPMSGHGIIAVATLCLEAGLVEMKAPETRLKFDTPAGMVRAYASVDDNRVRSVFFENVPSFAYALDQEVEVSGLGKVRVDIAYGGEFYAYVHASDLGLKLVPEEVHEVARLGSAICEAVEQAVPVIHPIDPVLSLLSGVVFCAPPVRRRDVKVDARQVCVFTDGAVDRSPSGTGLSGRLAIHHLRGEIDLGEPLVVEGLLGGVFTGKAAHGGLHIGPHPAIIAEIEGAASLTGSHCFFLDPEDLLKDGFLV